MPQTRLQKIAAMRAQRPGNAANEEWPRDIKPLRRGSKYEGEFERVGFRC